ncbi:unnamed protein product [Fusarium graminearum]|nr:unnamed protein product [Fusarium graminearum]CAF3589369.1 unnamed protein product [Fusarium graminearum]CAG1963224.1 unnamed protein product [Fusarium graminearum]CAG2008323.1 unnamed protein product [Fusarium graminearum]
MLMWGGKALREPGEASSSRESSRVESSLEWRGTNGWTTGWDADSNAFGSHHKAQVQAQNKTTFYTRKLHVDTVQIQIRNQNEKSERGIQKMTNTVEDADISSQKPENGPLSR